MTGTILDMYFIFFFSLCDKLEHGKYPSNSSQCLLINKRVLMNKLELVTSSVVIQLTNLIQGSIQNLASVAPRSDETELTVNYFFNLLIILFSHHVSIGNVLQVALNFA